MFKGLATSAYTFSVSLSFTRGLGSSTYLSSSILSKLTNYEQQGIPAGSGTISACSAFDLGRMHRLLAALGSPHKQWPVIHVAGSKGKGSTATMISSILRSSGYCVGLYTSPHLHSITERIKVQDSPISRLAFEALEAEHAALIEKQLEAEGGRLSHFEALTALAFRHFTDRNIDVAVVEAGMGGALDATNVFDERSLAAAVITSLGYEHVEALGGTIEAIAAAKAGIMKRGRPVVLAQQSHARALETLQQAAHSLSCSLIHAQHQVQVKGLGYILLDKPSSTLLRSSVAVKYRGIPKTEEAGSGLAASVEGISFGASSSSSKAGDSVLHVSSSGSSNSEGGMGAESLGEANRRAVAGFVESTGSGHRGRHMATGDADISIDNVQSSALSSGGLGGASGGHGCRDEAHTHTAVSSGGSNDSSTAHSTSAQTHQLGPLQVVLVGQHQETNIATAVTCCLELRAQGWEPITDTAICEGLEAARLPGRVQVLRVPPPVAMGDLAGSPPVQLLPSNEGPFLVLDGAHTRESASSLVGTVRTAFPVATHPLVLVVAMAEDKDARLVLAELRRIQPKAVIFTTVPIAGSYHRSAAPGALAAQWQAAGMLAAGDPSSRLRGCRELIQASLGAAYAKAKNELAGHTAMSSAQQQRLQEEGREQPRGVLVVTGSLHAVAATQQLEEVARQIAHAMHHEQ